MGEEVKGAVRALEATERRDRVLIVEDEDNARKGYEQLLQRWGCEVLGVSNAEDALAKFATFQPDALIADVELPGMNGLDLLQQLGPELHGRPRHHHHRKRQRRARSSGDRSRSFLVHRKAAERPGAARAFWIARSAARATPGSSWFATAAPRIGEVGRPGGRLQTHAGRDAAGGNGRTEFRFGADHRRNWFGQGNCRAHHSQACRHGPAAHL